MDKIKDHMNKFSSTINSDASAKEAASIMRDNSISSIMVVEGDDYVGIVTHRDMSEKVVAPGIDPDKVKVGSIMESPFITLDASLHMDEALLSMKKNHIRHIVVTVDTKVAGILSITDFANYHSQTILDPIAEFWGNSDILLDENMFNYAMDKLLDRMATKLGDATKTGKAIKDSEPLINIIQYAHEDGLNDFVDILKLAIKAN
ncbi:MAG: signal-transduction protein with cAMP-binding, CBS, and nucleotidyltransferase domain [Nitrospinales bacterium]|jgi:signal-transduction protein with cAMP-binding, CBS, and nucleotidyltransferase domain